MRAYELYENKTIVEDLSDDVMIEVEQLLGFENFKRLSGKRFAVLVPNKERKNVTDQLLKTLKGSVKIAKPAGVEYKGVLILVKPVEAQGQASAGLKNEQHLIDTINKFIKERGPLDITFIGDNGVSVSAPNVTEAVGVGADTKNRKKSDVNLISNGKLIPISIKKRNAEMWESADTYFGKKADEIIEKLLNQGKITLTPIGTERADGTPFVRISPEVAVETTKEQTLDLVFGNDILAGNGGVIKETFEDEHYIVKENNMTVTCDVVIKKLDDIPENMKAYLLIRNNKDRGRKGSKFPGLRLIASYASRVKNALKLDSSWMK